MKGLIRLPPSALICAVFTPSKSECLCVQRLEMGMSYDLCDKKMNNDSNGVHVPVLDPHLKTDQGPDYPIDPPLSFTSLSLDFLHKKTFQR